MSHRVRELRRFDSTDTCDSTGSDDGTLVVRKVRRKSTVQEGQPAGFVPKSANQNSPAPKENDNESPTKSTNQVVSQLKGDTKGLSPPPNNRSNINNNNSKGSASSVASNQSQQSSVASALAKDIEDPMEPIQLPKPGSISVPDIPQAQPRQMIYSLHSKPTPEVPPPAVQSPYEGHQKVVLPVRLGTAGNPPPATEQLYVDDGYQNGYNPRPSYPQQGPPSSSRDNSRRSSYTTPYNDPNAPGMQDYNRIEAFSYDGQQDPMSPRTYGHGLTSPPSNQHHSQVTSPYYQSQSQDVPIEYSPNPMHTTNHHQSPPPPSQQYTAASHKVQRIGASSSSVANSQVSGYTSVSSSSSYTANRTSAPPVRPPSPDAKKNDRLRTIVLANMSETEQIRIALLISTQDEKYGTNMFDSLNANDHVEIENMVQRGYKQEQALMTIFKRKFEPLGSAVKSPSRRPSVGPGPGSVNSGGYDSEASSHAPAPMLGHGHSRQPSYAGDYNSQGTPQTARSREYIGYHPEDDSEYYQQQQQQNGGYNNDDFDDGRSYTSHQQDNYSVRSGVSRNDQRIGASGHHRTSSGGAQNFVGYIDSYEPPAAALESMSITGGSLPPAPPPRRLYSAHSTSSLSRTSYPMSNNGHDGAAAHGSSGGHLPRTRSSYDRSEFATYDQYNAHPPVPGGSRALSRTMTPDSGYHDASAAPQHLGHVPYYMQDYEQHQQGYGYANGNTAPYHGGEEYYGDQYQQSGTYGSSNPSPRNNNNGYFSSGNSVVSAGGDRRIAANYASPPHGGSGNSTSGAYNTYYSR